MDLIILEAFPAYTFEYIADLSLDEWALLYAKARTMLEIVRRRITFDHDGVPVETTEHKLYTISEYEHLSELYLFEDQPEINQPAPQKYKIDPSTGQLITEGQEDTSEGDGFSFEVPF